jgi:hypothetical protein
MTSPYLMPGPVLITVEVERSIKALDPDELPENAGLVALARLYALALGEAGGTQNSLKEIGPKLAAVLGELRKKLSTAPLPLEQPTPAATELDAIEAARTEVDPALDELARARARADRARRPA